MTEVVWSERDALKNAMAPLMQVECPHDGPNVSYDMLTGEKFAVCSACSRCCACARGVVPQMGVA